MNTIPFPVHALNPLHHFFLLFLSLDILPSLVANIINMETGQLKCSGIMALASRKRKWSIPPQLKPKRQKPCTQSTKKTPSRTPASPFNTNSTPHHSLVASMATLPSSLPYRFLYFISVTTFIFYHSFFLGAFAQSEFDVDDLDWDQGKEDDVNVVLSGLNHQRQCDFSVGKWIYDQSYPLYEATCPYLSGKVNCQMNGRPDSDYEKWRWKPDGCNIPRFDALGFLGKMRRKRMMLVGDSIMRNQWESLVCLVEDAIPPEKKMVSYNGSSMAFHALDFEASIEFCWAPFLVELKLGPQNKRILKLDSIEENAKYWSGVDILVFDSAHWWTHSGAWSSWDFYKEGNRIFTNLNPMVAYEKGLITWARWIDLNLNPQRTRVIFRSISPKHNRENGLKCYNQREPLAYFRRRPHLPEQLFVLQDVLRRMSFPVYLQDITMMSALRRDGHPSVYVRSLTEEEAQHPEGHSTDCSHWCLPGVPDTWNEMLYALL